MGKFRDVGRSRALRFALAVASAVAVGTTMAPTASAAEGQVLYAGSPDAVPGSYIVAFKDTAAQDSGPLGGVLGLVHSLADNYASTITQTFTSALHGFAGNMTDQQARELAANPNVAYVQQNRRVHIMTTQSNPPSYGIDRIDQRNLPLNKQYAYSTTASNVHAYVIDTGIRVTHETFGGRAKFGFNAVKDGKNTDCNGHGTHVSGTVGGKEYGVAKGVQLTAVKVLDCDGSGTTAQVAAGIDWVTAHAVHPAVANMSLGSDAKDATIDAAVRKSIASGVTYSIASGNSSADACNSSPADVSTAITVNASDKTDKRAYYSNYGKCTDIFAPGDNITSSWNTSDTAKNTISGTSMATPHVTGTAALYLAKHPKATPAQVQTALKNNATKNKIGDPGAGSPNLLAYTASGVKPAPTKPDKCAPVTSQQVKAIEDESTVSSPITINCAGKANPASQITVNIKHSYRGDLVLDLISPSGKVVNLLNRQGGGAKDVKQTFTRDLSAQAAKGTWTLRVSDEAFLDTGYLDSWSLNV